MKITVINKASNRKPAPYCGDFVDAPMVKDR
jgi:hypothetical protein